MTAELIIAPEALQDLDEAYSWYEDRRPGLGEEFFGCVDACIQIILKRILFILIYHRNIARKVSKFLKVSSSIMMTMDILPESILIMPAIKLISMKLF